MNGRLAIIPARGGSKRLPRKNIRDFCGKPIIAYSIETALKSGLFTEIMVSTDDDEISAIALARGAKVPFLRSAATANDHAGLAEVVLEVLACYRDAGVTFAQVCCILPTAPLILETDLAEAHRLLEQGGFDSVFPVVRFSYPIQRALQRKDNATTMMWPENYAARSQDLPPAFHDCGQFYWLDAAGLPVHKRFFTGNSASIVLPETRVQDVDTEEDWRICELKYSLMHSGAGSSASRSK